ncbi:MAG: hypothetical protein JWO62_3109 [Acidimicrobiaceae bacterium]|nr:hypothetical protein [Acidimicrobiaceae bacterium]
MFPGWPAAGSPGVELVHTFDHDVVEEDDARDGHPGDRRAQRHDPRLERGGRTLA